MKVKKIKNFEKYTIDEEGTVYSYWNEKPRKLKPWKISRGYLHVILHKNKKRYHFSIHRLVALTFLRKRKHYLSVNHKDGNILNNKLSNLEWTNPRHNAKHARENGLYRIGNKHPSSILTETQVRFIKFKAPKLKIKGKKLAEMFGVCKTTISEIKAHRSWKHVTK